ncbi:MAG: hypothetical protein IJV31_02245 [Clostridia bacterium]|nr:hypothetical protein [Clostridia bacterium]
MKKGEIKVNDNQENTQQESMIEIKETIASFINPDKPEQSTEEAINEYYQKKLEELEQTEIDEEIKKKKKKKLKEQQEELLHSINVTIPGIVAQFEKFARDTGDKKKTRISSNQYNVKYTVEPNKQKNNQINNQEMTDNTKERE